MSKYLEMTERLDLIIEQIQSGNLDVDESIKKYQEASKIIIKLNKYLQDAENKLSEIKIELSD